MNKNDLAKNPVSATGLSGLEAVQQSGRAGERLRQTDMGIPECYPCTEHLAFTIKFNPNNSTFTHRETKHAEVEPFSEDYVYVCGAVRV